MFVIGERINGMYKAVREAISQQNSDFIKDLAKEQIAAGADALDITVGPVKGDAKEYMKWLVNTVSSAVDAPLCIDSPHPDIIEVGVKEATGRTIINSLKKSPEHLEKLIPLARDNESDLICLLMTDSGIPHDINGKLEVAVELIEAVMMGGVEPSHIYFDPILLPVKNAQKDVADTFELMDQLRILTDPPPNMIVGLSNLSQKAKYRSLLNRTYCTMAMSHGLTAAIVDPLDEKLMKSIKTADILLDRELYAKSYLKG
ncbi:MAG: dihydropteroate synthase [Candidatus Eremiobacteraeota bacterium]|nr:dihydropteroate synthase [Candidatus Eremiobacteraeota bacterium]